MPRNSLEKDVPKIEERSGWSSLIAQCDPSLLCVTVDQVLQVFGEALDLRVIHPAETGSIQLPVREPVRRERFLLADAIVSTAEVSVNGVIGWSMRIGTDKKAAMAGAIADALLAGDFSLQTAPIVTLLTETRRTIIDERNSKWEEIGKTIISFEELD